MKNPFIVGRQFDPNSFLDREQETAYLLEEVEQQGNMVIYGTRRLGKTWLIEKVFYELAKQKEFKTLFFDIQQYPTISFFISDFVNKLYQSSSFEGKFEYFFKKFLPKTHTYFSISLGPIKFELHTQNNNDLYQAFVEALQIPEKLSSKKKYVIAFDEFQEFSVIDDSVIPIFRSQIQHQKEASYIFAGSRESMLKKIFFSKNAPFFKAMKQLHLTNYLPLSSCSKYLSKSFYNSGKKISPDGIETILNISKGHPLFLQLLSRRAWQKTESICDKDIVEAALTDELSTRRYEYETLYQCVRTKEQRIVLFSLAMDDSVPFSQEGMNRYGIVHPNSLNRAVSQLIVMDFIEKLDRGKYRFSDLFFKEFIRRRML
ncbi:MAG: ATP-binding protein [Caldisericia bacterium]|nr:ATP-binding protein [Caldisericia bacterium]